MPSYICYAQREKEKSQRVLEAFASGTGAKMAWTDARELAPDAVPVFYGVRPAWAHLWEQAKREQRAWIYVDNAYFDVSREKSFRIVRSRIQHSGKGSSSGYRFRQLGVLIKPAVGACSNIVLACAQSDEFMRTVALDPDWLARNVESARKAGYQVLVRYKGEKRPYAEDLARARIVMSYSSACSVGALLAGVEVKCSDQCCAFGVDMGDRERWAGVLADNQWTLEEISKGVLIRKALV